MVGVLISLKFTMLRHTPRGMRLLGWVVGGLLVLATWGAVVAADGGVVRAQVLMLLAALWTAGAAVGPVTMSGPGVLRPDYFALPLDRRRLALGLLVATFPGVASGYVLLGALAVVVLAATSGAAAAAVPVALVAAVLSWVLALTLSRVVFAVLGAAMRTRLGVEISAMQFGLLISGMIAGWLVVVQAFQTVPDLLAQGVGRDVDAVLRWLPSSWGVRAVEAAGAGSVGEALGWLGALAAVGAVLVLAAALLLRVDVGGSSGRARRRPLGSRVLERGPVLPTDATGAVLGKEIRQWWRDPWRSLELRTAIWTGLFIGSFALLSTFARELAAFGGLVVAFMVALGGCNLYGQDGSALWMTVVGERRGTVRADVRGRQRALLLLFGPPAVVVSIGFVVIGQAWWAWPVLVAMLPALFGAASGIAVLMSAVGVSPGVDPRRRTGPNDAGGDLSLQAQVAFWVTPLLTAPTILALVLGATGVIGPGGGPPWWAAPAGVLNGVAAYAVLGRVAIAYLEDRLPVVFTQIRYRRYEDDGTSTLAVFARTSQKGEDTARAAKEKERRERVGAAAVDRGSDGGEPE